MIKKLCIFTLSFAFNRQLMLDFLEYALPKEVELFLFTPKEYNSTYSCKRIKIVETKCSKYNSFFELRKFCRKNKIDRIFSMGALPQEGFVMAFASILSNTDFMCHLVVNPFDAFKKFNKPGIKAFFEFLLLFPLVPLSKKFYVNAFDTAERAKKFFFFSKKKVDFLIYMVDTKIFYPRNKKKARKKLHLPLNKKIMIFVGRIEKEKGSDIILQVAEKNKDKLFILIGQLFDEEMKKTKLKNVLVISPQNRKSLSDYYNASDLCFFPSRAEGFGVVSREAMVCGVPALVSNISGLRLIKPAIKASLTAEDFDKKMNDFFKMSKKELTSLSFKSRKFVLNECSLDICKKLYIEKILTT